MIFRRIKAHIAKEDWFAVFIDFIIVVFGVFMGFQVNNWNEGRKETARSAGYLQRIADDINSDIENYQNRIKFWNDVRAYGKTGLQYSETEEAVGASPWQILLAYFHASQVAEFSVTSSTYDELKNAGELDLIKSQELRINLAAYYNFEAAETLRQRPIYREHIRGKIPTDIQSYIWKNCWSSNSQGHQVLKDCPSPVDEIVAKNLVERISTNIELMEELRFWASTLEVSTLLAKDRISEATSVMFALEQDLGKSRKAITP